MNRNVTIVIIILVLVVIAGYLVWIRSRYQSPVSPKSETEVQNNPTTEPTPSASPTSTPQTKEATGSMRQKTSSPSSTSR